MRTALVVVSLLVLGARFGAQSSAVVISHDEANAAYNVTVGGKAFTSYRYGKEFPDKPVFYPVMSPNGARVNREYPMVKGVAGESSDHPHHQSLFFTYDEVNGTNFWNPEQTGRRIEHERTSVAGNRLTSQLNWKDKDGQTILRETKVVTFGGGGDVFLMYHDITLRAAVPVRMGDTKEGAFGLRLNDTLKENGGTGRYINAEGMETAAKVWGGVSPWVAIRGKVEGDKPVTVAMFAHRLGFNYPPYWHARDYGLFAANPFGRRGYQPTAPERITTLAADEEITLRFCVAVYEGNVDKARLDKDFTDYSRLEPGK
jgi:hypothetical protein